MPIQNRSFMGKGTIYIRERGSTEGLLTLGNCSGFDLAFNTDKKEQKDYESAGGALVASDSRISSVTGSVTALSFHSRNLALALRGLVNVIAGGAQVAEPHVAYADSLVPFDFLPDKSQAITVTSVGGTVTYVAGVDYVLKNSGIRIVDTGAIADASTIEVNYTSENQYSIEGLTVSGKEYELVFDGLNEANTGKAVRLTNHKVTITPTQALAMIADDYGELPLEFDILKDETKDGSTESQFVKIEITQ